MTSSQQLSVVLTIKSAVERINSGCLKQSSESMIIHCLGATEVEFPSFDVKTLMTAYRELFLPLSELCNQINIVFIGPNLNPEYHGKSCEEFFGSMRIVFSCFVRVYHDYWKEVNLIDGQIFPDLVVMLNAGIWGYPSWIPTLDCFLEVNVKKMACQNINIVGYPGRIFFVVTAYTLEEAEDDEDTIRDYYTSRLKREDVSCSTALEDQLMPVWLWESEINPNMSTEPLDRPSKVEGRIYYDNHAWQCFQFSLSTTNSTESRSK